jgi:hypothetical protein
VESTCSSYRSELLSNIHVVALGGERLQFRQILGE